MPQIRASGGVAVTSGVTVQNKTGFTITGLTAGLVETSLVIPAGTKAFRLQAIRSAGVARITVSHISGGTSAAGTSFDISPGTHWKEDLLDGTGFTIYLKSSKASTGIQVILWS